MLQGLRRQQALFKAAVAYEMLPNLCVTGVLRSERGDDDVHGSDVLSPRLGLSFPTSASAGACRSRTCGTEGDDRLDPLRQPVGFYVSQ